MKRLKSRVKIAKRNKTAYFEGPKEFAENYLKQSYYPDERKELIEEAYKRGFSLDALRLLGNTSFNKNQARQLYEGLLQLPLDKVKLYANRNLYYLQMEIIKNALISHMPQEKLNLLLQDIDYAQAKEINQGIEDGLDMEKLKWFSDPNLNWKEMHIRRNSKKASRRNKMQRSAINYNEKIYKELINKLNNLCDEIDKSNILKTIKVIDDKREGKIDIRLALADSASKYLDIEYHPINISDELFNKFKEIGDWLEDNGGYAACNNTGNIFWFSSPNKEV